MRKSPARTAVTFHSNVARAVRAERPERVGVDVGATSARAGRAPGATRAASGPGIWSTTKFGPVLVGLRSAGDLAVERAVLAALRARALDGDGDVGDLARRRRCARRRSSSELSASSCWSGNVGLLDRDREVAGRLVRVLAVALDGRCRRRSRPRTRAAGTHASAHTRAALLRCAEAPKAGANIPRA